MQNKLPIRWLLLRGLGREKRHWLEFLKLFGEEHDQVVALDLPGFGDQNEKSSPISVFGITNEIRKRFQSVRGDAQWGILGVSMGGMVALDWAARWPMDFRCGVVINSSSKDSGDLWERLSAFGMYKTFQILMSNPDLLKREKLVIEMISNLRKDDAEALKEFVRIAKDRPSSFANLSRQLIAANRFLSPEKVPIPLLFLASLKDHMVNVRCSKQLADNYKARIKFHSSAGHDLTFDDPQWATDRIVEFERELLGEGRVE